MKPKLIVSFSRYTEDAFQAKAGLIIASLTGNAHYPEPWAPQVGTLAQLDAALVGYRASYVDSVTRDTRKIRARAEARDLLTEMLQILAPYLEMMAEGDIKVLESTGYDLRAEPSRNGTSTDPLPAPAGLKVTHGRSSGELAVRVAKLSGAVSYEVALSQGDGGPSAEWRHAKTSASGARIVLEHLPPGQTFWVRVRAVGSAGPGLWTEPARIMVV